MADVKINYPLLLRATGYLYRKAHTYNLTPQDMPMPPLSWTKHYLAEVPQHFHLMLQDLYLAWRYFVCFFSNSPILSRFRGSSNRVCRRLKGLNKS